MFELRVLHEKQTWQPFLAAMKLQIDYSKHTHRQNTSSTGYSLTFCYTSASTVPEFLYFFDTVIILKTCRFVHFLGETIEVFKFCLNTSSCTWTSHHLILAKYSVVIRNYLIIELSKQDYKSDQLFGTLHLSQLNATDTFWLQSEYLRV